MREQDLQNDILEYLSYRRGKYWRINAGAVKLEDRFVRLAPKGFSDIIGITEEGQFVAIEVKLPKRKPTESQEHFLKTINNNGGLGFVARSVQDVIDKGL